MRRLPSLILLLIGLSMTACSRSAGAAAAPPPAGSVTDLAADKATGPANAHFIYCKSQSADLEAGLDFGTAVLSDSIDALSGKIGNRAPGTQVFSSCTINSISKTSMSGKLFYGIVCTSSQGLSYVYSVSTSDYKSAKLNFSDWDHKFEKTASCTIYQTNPFAGTQAWP